MNEESEPLKFLGQSILQYEKSKSAIFRASKMFSGNWYSREENKEKTINTPGKERNTKRFNKNISNEGLCQRKQTHKNLGEGKLCRDSSKKTKENVFNVCKPIQRRKSREHIKLQGINKTQDDDYNISKLSPDKEVIQASARKPVKKCKNNLQKNIIEMERKKKTEVQKPRDHITFTTTPKNLSTTEQVASEASPSLQEELSISEETEVVEMEEEGEEEEDSIVSEGSLKEEMSAKEESFEGEEEFEGFPLEEEEFTQVEYRKESDQNLPPTQHIECNLSQPRKAHYEEAAKYYPTRIDLMTDIRLQSKEHFMQGLASILEETLRDYKFSKKDEMGKMTIKENEPQMSENYENVEELKMRRIEKYRSKKTQSLEDLYVGEAKSQDSDAKWLPFFRQREDKGSTNVVEEIKKEKKPWREGPFDILERKDVSRNVWRAALKRACKKIKYLKEAVEYRKKHGWGHEKLHAHFKSRFRKKRREIDEMLTECRPMEIIEMRNIDLSEVETRLDSEPDDESERGEDYFEKGLMNCLIEGNKTKVIVSRMESPRKLKASIGKDRVRMTYLHPPSPQGVERSREEKVKEVARLLVGDVPPIQPLPSPVVPKEATEEELPVPSTREVFHAFCSKHKMSQLETELEEEELQDALASIAGALEPFQHSTVQKKQLLRRVARPAIAVCQYISQVLNKELSLANDPERDDIFIKMVMENATVNRKRQFEWLNKYYGFENCLTTEKKMFL